VQLVRVLDNFVGRSRVSVLKSYRFGAVHEEANLIVPICASNDDLKFCTYVRSGGLEPVTLLD
jgi:hypothetical protein